MQSFKLVNSTFATSHLDANTSQIMKIINIAVKEMNEPIDDIVFHVVHACGQSDVRAFLRGPEWEESFISSHYYHCNEDFCPRPLIVQM